MAAWELVIHLQSTFELLPKSVHPRNAKGVVAASRRSDRQFKLASAGYTVDSEAADKLFSSTLSTPASSVNPNCLDSQDTHQQGAKAVTHHARSP